jgi:L,D-peptidoglycan transpeptidase YkuD (ErfK/YbiS/YcfS/YnhG family)
MRAALAVLLLFAACARGFELPGDCRQCVVGVAPDWDSSDAKVSIWEKRGGDWERTAGPWAARLGKKGLVWGLGLHPAPEGVATKREGDGRAPAGVFKIGAAWGYEADVERNPTLPYARITPNDLWVEDPVSADYNRHVRLARAPVTAWEKKQQMKQGDSAHALKLFIAHNAEPVVPGAGSAIFFHIWRAGGAKASAGCTVVAEENLRRLIAAIDPAKNPVYVLLPAGEYRRLRGQWKLP